MNDEIHFNLIELSSHPIDDIYPEFKKDFLNPIMKIDKLKQKYSLSKRDYYYLREKVLTETGLNEKPSLKGARRLVLEDSKYLVKHIGGNYSIFKKNKNGIIEFYGRYPTFGIAVHVRNKLIENNWDENVLNELQEKYALKK